MLTLWAASPTATPPPSDRHFYGSSSENDADSSDGRTAAVKGLQRN